MGRPFVEHAADHRREWNPCDQMVSKQLLAGVDVHVDESPSVLRQTDVAMGDVCYSDEKRFPTGPWCAVGDWVMFRPYSGTRFKIRGQEFRLINDDTIEAVVDDPREYSRAY